MLTKICISLLTLASFGFMHEGLADRHTHVWPVYIKGLLKPLGQHCIVSTKSRVVSS